MTRRPMEAGIEGRWRTVGNEVGAVAVESGQIREGTVSQGKDFGFDFEWNRKEAAEGFWSKEGPDVTYVVKESLWLWRREDAH